MSQSAEMSIRIADNLIDKVGAELATLVFNDTFEGETFIEMRQKTAELVTKIDFIASALRKSARTADNFERSNQILKERIPYDQASQSIISQNPKSTGTEKPKNIATGYTYTTQNEIKKANSFIMAEGKERNISEKVALDGEALASLEQYEKAINHYSHYIDQYLESYTYLSEHIDLYDRGQTQSKATLERSFLNSPTFQGKLSETDFAPLSDRLEGMRVGVPYNNTDDKNGTPATEKYTYLSELDERTRLTYEEHEQAKNEEYDAAINRGESRGLRGTMIPY